jgi:lysophospholipase L1-like esterase
MNTYTYLALGDSYTIGEQVPFAENYPNQAVQLLRKKGVDFHAPEIVARTGWTTDELQFGINNRLFRNSYDFVTLLIGVNNQYRGRSAEEYEEQFTVLLEQALAFAGNRKERVAVLSIPDWGITPFAATRDKGKIAEEIDRFNEVNQRVSTAAGIHYIYITGLSREAAQDSSLLAPDGLHPSGKEYQRWAEKVVTFFCSTIN